MIYQQIWDDYLFFAYLAINEKSHTQAKDIYMQMVCELRHLYSRKSII